MCFPVGDIVPSDSPILRELLTEELVNDVEQLQQTLSMLRSQRSVLQQEIERLEVSVLLTDLCCC